MTLLGTLGGIFQDIWKPIFFGPPRPTLTITDFSRNPPGPSLDSTLAELFEQLVIDTFRLSDDLNEVLVDDAVRVGVFQTKRGMLQSESTGDSSWGQAVHFALSNTGEGTLLVDDIFLEVIESDPFVVYSFPIGPQAPMVTHKFDIELSSSSRKFLVTDRKFSYQPGEIEAFWIKITSAEHRWYKIQPRIRWRVPDSPNHFRVARGYSYVVSFPEVRDFQLLVSNARSIKGRLNVAGLDELAQHRDDLFTNPEFELLIPGLAYWASQGDTIRPASEGITWVSPLTGSLIQDLKYEYLIIDEQAVLCRIGNEGFLVRDPGSVSKFIDTFQTEWNYGVTLKSKADMLKILADPQSTTRLQVAAAHQLRNFPHDDARLALIYATASNRQEVRETSMRSLHILAPEQIPWLREELEELVMSEETSGQLTSRSAKWILEELNYVP